MSEQPVPFGARKIRGLQRRTGLRPGARLALQRTVRIDESSRILVASLLLSYERIPGTFMNRVAIWFERKFEFTFPVELHPNLCARLRGTPARLEEMVRGTAHEILIRKPRNKWSAQEHAGHLLDLEPLWMARVDDYLVGGSELTAADLKNRKTDDANYNARALDEILKEFREARSRLVKRVEAMDAALFSRSLVHPRLKQSMRMVDHLYFAAEHDDHHLACIWELLNVQAGHECPNYARDSV